MQEFIRAGVDLAKDYFQVHALNSKDEQATARKLSRQAMQKFFAETRPCLAGMEARASAPRAGRRDWAGALIAIGRDVPLIPPIFVKPCGKRVKTMPPARKRSSRGHVAPRHASPVNSEEQQAGLMPDKTRAGLDQATDDERQRLVRSSCGVRPCRSKGIGRGDALIAKAATDAALAGIAKAALTGVAGHPETIAARITEGGARIARAHPQSPVSRLPAGIPG
ncbi:MAG: hypothetical protein ACRECN_02755, partial [Methylocella sp.]